MKYYSGLVLSSAMLPTWYCDAVVYFLERTEQLDEIGTSAEAARERGMIVGTATAVQEQLDQRAEVGAERIMLQWMALDDLDGLAALAAAVL